MDCREVEKAMERKNDEIDVLAIREAFAGSGCRRALMSSCLNRRG
jgi:hypothetical protein